MTTDRNKRIAGTEGIRAAKFLLPVAIFLLGFLVVSYLGPHHTLEDQRTFTNSDLTREFPDAELIAPTLPPKHWDETTRSWLLPKGQVDEQQERIRLQAALEKLLLEKLLLEKLLLEKLLLEKLLKELEEQERTIKAPTKKRKALRQ